jgi:hypothetical protein
MAAPLAWNKRAVCSYADAFKEFGLEDPEVVGFASRGIKSAPEYEAVFRNGRCTPHGIAEWPVDSERWATIGFVHPDPERRSAFGWLAEPAPVEIVSAAEALLRKYCDLMGMLRQGEREAYGVAESTGLVERIPQSIWRHRDFYISAQGDVFQTNHQCENPPFDLLVKRWSAVELRTPTDGRATASTFHVQPTTFDETPSSTNNYGVSSSIHRATRERRAPKRQAVARALIAEGIVQRPVGLTDKEIAVKIRGRVSDLNMTNQALEKAIARHFMKHSLQAE